MHLLDYTNKTMLNYKEGPVAEPTSIAQIAADPSDNHSTNARQYISIVQDQLLIICTLASYLFGDGNPAFAIPIEQYPHCVTITPSWDISGATTPHIPPSRIPEVHNMTEREKEIIGWDPRYQVVVAVANRAYHDTNRHGSILTMIFFALVVWIPEIQKVVMEQLASEGINDGDLLTLKRYISSELRAFSLSAMNYENAAEFWSVTWAAMTSTIHMNDFHRMSNAIQARETAQLAVSEETREKTKAKRQSRAMSRMRKNDAKKASRDEENAMDQFPDTDVHTLANQIAGFDDPLVADQLAQHMGVNSDDDDDDDVSDIVH